MTQFVNIWKCGLAVELAVKEAGATGSVQEHMQRICLFICSDNCVCAFGNMSDEWNVCTLFVVVVFLKKGFFFALVETYIYICQSGHSYHFFADDSQLHNSSTPSDFPVLVHSLKDCIEDVTEWMCDSVLKMNHDKIELIAIGTKPKISQVTLSLTPVVWPQHTFSLSLLEILVSL